MHPSACASINMCIHQHVHPSACASINMCIHQHVHPSACASISMCIHQHVHPSACASISMCIHQHVHPSACDRRKKNVSEKKNSPPPGKRPSHPLHWSSRGNFLPPTADYKLSGPGICVSVVVAILVQF